jgi:hypothetical protein
MIKLHKPHIKRKFVRYKLNKRGFNFPEIAFCMICMVYLSSQFIGVGTEKVRESKYIVSSSDFQVFSTGIESAFRDTPSMASMTTANVYTTINTYLDDSYQVDTTGTSAKDDPWGDAYTLVVSTVQHEDAGTSNNPGTVDGPGTNDGFDAEMYIYIKSNGPNRHTSAQMVVDSDDCVEIVQSVNSDTAYGTYGLQNNVNTIGNKTNTNELYWFVYTS